MAEHTPHESYVRHRYISGVADIHDTPEWEGRAEFDRFLARVRRDAAREALKQFRKIELGLIPPDADEDDPIRVRQQALAWRIEMRLLANYPEDVTPNE